MKLFVPEPAITLYQDGFDTHDLLDRKAQGKHLSKLVENISDPMVIALDGEWGSGKTVFLKCWVGELATKHTETIQPIYFDAFEHDYMNDPLIALIGAIDARLPKDQDNKIWQTIKNAVPWLARTAMRLGLAAATAGATEMTGVMADAAVNKASSTADEHISSFWEQEAQKQESLKTFKQAIRELASKQKLVIVIDELDRCRPDFALSTLEIVKHLFNVPNVHFVFGVNLKPLGAMAENQYGGGIDGLRYLEKFFSHKWKLNNIGTSIPFDTSSDVAAYVKQVCKRMEMFEKLTDAIENTFTAFAKDRVISLREINKFIAELALIYSTGSTRLGKSKSLDYMKIMCCIVKHFEPKLFPDLDNPELVFLEIVSLFNCAVNEQDDQRRETRGKQMLFDICSYYLSPKDFKNYGKFEWYPHDIDPSAGPGEYYHPSNYFRRNILSKVSEIPVMRFDE